MLKFLEKLRALPEGSRKAVVLFSSASITTVLIVSWLVFPVPHFGALTDAEKERKSATDLTAPFSIISGEVHQATGDIKEKWSSFKGLTGILSAVSALQENMEREATSTATSTPETNVFLEQSFIGENNATTSTSTNNTTATTTATGR
jgi:hypothetical protein